MEMSGEGWDVIGTVVGGVLGTVMGGPVGGGWARPAALRAGMLCRGHRLHRHRRHLSRRRTRVPRRMCRHIRLCLRRRV